jgi:four helix bundle protein
MTVDRREKAKEGSMNSKKVYDLEERTARFGESIIDFARTLPHNVVNNGLISQMVRSGTSIGANYMEADAAESKRDFRHKIAICKKESKETKHWLRMIAKGNPDKRDQCKKLWSEVQELTLIFSSILSSTSSPEKSLAGNTMGAGSLKRISQG